MTLYKQERMTITYEDFFKEIEMLGYKAYTNVIAVGFIITFAGAVMEVSRNEVGEIDIATHKLANINAGEKLGKAFYLTHLLANTPLDERGTL